MTHRITVLPTKQNIEATAGENLLDVLRAARIFVNAPCGGNGSCGKCKVLIDGKEALACKTIVSRDMTVSIPTAEMQTILTDGTAAPSLLSSGLAQYILAFDIGTTTVAGYLLDGYTGQQLACGSDRNPQTVFGADVISRIQHALNGHMDNLTGAIRDCLENLTLSLCRQAGLHPEQIRIVSIVGNPAMQQLFMGILPENLARIPFSPVLTHPETVDAKLYLPCLTHAKMLVVPDISGFVGADTIAGVLATDIMQRQEPVLLVDIGTNGEMVLGNKHRMVACSTAAGPALEGANIHFGMRAQNGAIDHVWLEGENIVCSVIGGGEAVGICGSGLIDAVAVALDLGWLNKRGRIQNQQRIIPLTERVYLTQEDIRQVQLAKGAIAAGIELMAKFLDIPLQDIHSVYLAGAFGTYMRASAVCRIGLLPPELEEKIEAVGNAAGSGAKILAASEQALAETGALTAKIEFLELANAPDFQRCFARNMRFSDAQQYWIGKALAVGFSVAAPLEISTLKPRQDVRDMCAADKCRAYGKNWTCPPHCGTLDTCSHKMGQYRQGILLQTVGKTAKRIDTKGYRRTEQQHMEQFHRLAAQIRALHKNALCLGAGGCRICKQCAYPDPCRFPEKAYPSMEGYGLFVTQVCRDSGCDYYHGENTITYTACILF